MKKTYLVSIVVIAACLLSTAFALSYTYHASNQTSGDVTEGTLNIYCTLTLSSSQINEGQQWTLTAVLSPIRSNIPIIFKEGSTILGTVNTDTNGIATLTLTPAVGHHDYNAYPPGT